MSIRIEQMAWEILGRAEIHAKDGSMWWANHRLQAAKALAWDTGLMRNPEWCVRVKVTEGKISKLKEGTYGRA